MSNYLWSCYQPGDLNPQLMSNRALGLSLDPMAALYGRRPLNTVGGVLFEKAKTRPPLSSITAVVLGGEVLEGATARSYNMSLGRFNSAANNRVQILYVRVPEIHSMLQDPYCDDSVFGPYEANVITELHTHAAVPNWSTSTPSILAGSLVEIDVLEGWSRATVNRVLELETIILDMYQLESAKNIFKSATSGEFLGLAENLKEEVWKKVFSHKNTAGVKKWWVKKSTIPDKVTSVPNDFQRFMAANGRSDVKAVNNGYHRSLQRTRAGGTARSPQSLHLFGLAQDLTIATDSVALSMLGDNGKELALDVRNHLLIKDHNLVRLMKSFALSTGLVWGGEMKRGDRETVPAGDGMSEFFAWTMELHHYELSTSDMESLIHPDVKGALKGAGFTVKDMYTNKTREHVYAQIETELPMAQPTAPAPAGDTTTTAAVDDGDTTHLEAET